MADDDAQAGVAGALNPEETRLYGALLAMIGDQLASVRKAAGSPFPFLGQRRIRARNKNIERCLYAIIEGKAETHGEAALSAILADLNAIEDDRARWPDVSADQIDCVRKILRNV